MLGTQANNLAVESTESIIKNPIEHAVQLMHQANQANEDSRQLILDANTVRKQLKEQRTALIRAKNNPQINSKESQEKIAQLVEKLESNQTQGANLRQQSKLLKQQAAEHFEKGFVQKWKQWVSNTEPLTMDDTVKNIFAHNAQLRSVHKNMLEKANTPEETISQKRDDMSLQVPALVEQNAPPDLNINAFKFSRQEQYFAHIEVHTDETTQSSQSKNVAAVPLNKIHQWRLMISDINGEPLENVKIQVEGHMPGHVHGLPTAPEVTQEIAPGVYLVDGVKFQMKGWWVMKFILPSDLKNKANSVDLNPDFFTFNLVL